PLRSLHSFPTRRSSDLVSSVSPSRYPTVTCRIMLILFSSCALGFETAKDSLRRASTHRMLTPSRLEKVKLLPHRSLISVDRRMRSEEHTSELQSPCNLV